MDFDHFFPPPPPVHAPSSELFAREVDQLEVEWGRRFQRPPVLPATDLSLDMLALYRDDFTTLPSVSTETLTSDYPYPETPSELSGLSNVIDEYAMNEQYFNDVLSFGSLPASPSSLPLQMAEASSGYGASSGVQGSSPHTQQPAFRSPPVTPHGELDGPPQSRPAKTHKCPTCGLISKRRHNLKTHMETHDPERLRRFVCHHPSCQWRFSRKHDLKRHLGTRHRESEAPSDPSLHPIGT